MFNVTDTAKRFALLTAAVAVVGTIIAMFFVSNKVPFACGAVFGTVFSVLKIMLLDRTINKAVDMQEKDATNHIRLNYTLRYFLTGAILVVSATNPHLDLFGAILGILSMPVAAYGMKFFVKDKLD